jgi:uncharacterized phage-associated protein
MFFRFSTKKTIQATGVLLRLARGRMCYLRLLKLLYIADRENLLKSHRPIIGTRTVAMKNGPLHSEVYNLIKGEHSDETLWSEFICREGYEVELLKDPGVSELSPCEVRTLTDTSEHYRSLGEWELVEVTHDFPEWIKNYQNPNEDTSSLIPFADMLDALGLSDEKAEILAEAEEKLEMDRLFAQARFRAAQGKALLA